MKVYEGFRDEDGVMVLVNGLSLDPRPSQKLYNHSPDGFEWGYGGSGPSQLALAILLDYTQDKNMALGYYQQFKDFFVAALPRDKKGQVWGLTGEQIDEFLAKEIERSRP